MKYRIVALIDSSPHEFQALSSLLMERAETFEVQRVNGRDARRPTAGEGSRGANRWPKSMTIKLAAAPQATTQLRLDVYEALKKKYADKPFRKGDAVTYLKKVIGNGSPSPVLTWLCDNGHVVRAL